MFLEVPCYLFPCPFCAKACGVLEDDQFVIPVKSDVVCSIFVCKGVQDNKSN